MFHSILVYKQLKPQLPSHNTWQKACMHATSNKAVRRDA